MNCYIIEEFETFAKVRFYTIYKDGDVYTETDKFFARFLGEDGYTKDDLNFREDFDAIVNLIETMGQKHGAKDLFFRHEKAAHALPSKSSKKISTIVGIAFAYMSNQLRLYCIRLTDKVVIF